MRWLWLCAILVAGGCWGDPGLDELRLVPSDDPDFGQLELPEQGGECGTGAAGCEPTCVHACASDEPGPITCPSDPPPRPDRLDGADCRCEASVCAWMPP